jgi:hypothetical protein
LPGSADAKQGQLAEMKDGARYRAGRHRFLLDLMHDRSGRVLEAWSESELLVSGHPVGIALKAWPEEGM